MALDGLPLDTLLWRGCMRLNRQFLKYIFSLAVQGGVMRPRKTFYRARAHSNPFNDGMHLEIPPHPDAYDW